MSETGEPTEEEIKKVQMNLFKRLCPFREVPCKEWDCGLWVEEENACAIKVIAKKMR